MQPVDQGEGVLALEKSAVELASDKMPSCTQPVDQREGVLALETGRGFFVETAACLAASPPPQSIIPSLNTLSQTNEEVCIFKHTPTISILHHQTDILLVIDARNKGGRGCKKRRAWLCYRDGRGWGRGGYLLAASPG